MLFERVRCSFAGFDWQMVLVEKPFKGSFGCQYCFFLSGNLNRLWGVWYYSRIQVFFAPNEFQYLVIVISVFFLGEDNKINKFPSYKNKRQLMLVQSLGAIFAEMYQSYLCFTVCTLWWPTWNDATSDCRDFNKSHAWHLFKRKFFSLF